MLIPVIALATAAIIGEKNLSEADANRAYAKRMTLKNLNRMGEARKMCKIKRKAPNSPWNDWQIESMGSLKHQSQNLLAYMKN